MNEGRWVTINGAHVFVKEGQSPMDAFIKQQARSKTTVYRAGATQGKMDSGTFFAVNESDASNYGQAEKYEFDETINLYDGYNSQDYARENNIAKIKDENLKAKLGVDTLEEVEEIHQNWITPSYLDKDPNLYFYAYQYMAKKDLKKKGYDGAHWKAEDELTPEQYQIWNEKKFRKI